LRSRLSTFIGHLNDGSAEKAFQEDLETTRRYGVNGFPTFLFRHAGKKLLLRGYQDFRAMEAVIDTLTGGTVQARAPKSGPEDVLHFSSAMEGPPRLKWRRRSA